MTTPINKSFLSNNKFEFTMQRLPNLVFFVQSVNLPEIALTQNGVPSPFTQVKVPGNQLVYGEISLTLMMDEDFLSWFEIYNWMSFLGNADSYNKRGPLSDSPGRINSVTSDAALIIKTNSNNPNIVVDFKDCFPTNLSELTFTSTESHDFLTFNATFGYTSYSARRYT